MVEVAAAPDRHGPLAVNLAVAVAYAAPLALRRRAPLAALAVALAGVLAMTFTLTSVESLFVPYVTALALVYAAGAHRDGRESYASLVLIVAALPAIVSTFSHAIFGDFFFPALIGAFAWVAGRIVRARTRLTVELHEAAAQLAEANEEEQRLAAVDERRRIAREMHDLVAHSISVMVVQAGGARRILDRDPTRALEAATRIERTGREALTEMRHLLGMLSDGAEPPALAPQPTLAEVGELVNRARLAGLPTVLDIRGRRRPLPAGLDLAAYRIVQEALTNAIKHAPGAETTVTVDWGAELALEILDHGRGSSSDGAGHGLVGMRERVRLYGGSFEAGPCEAGWRVRATLPTDVRELSLV
jgi:signal transduction histidine kinase